jgi:hypothetical protein
MRWVCRTGSEEKDHTSARASHVRSRTLPFRRGKISASGATQQSRVTSYPQVARKRPLTEFGCGFRVTTMILSQARLVCLTGDRSLADHAGAPMWTYPPAPPGTCPQVRSLAGKPSSSRRFLLVFRHACSHHRHLAPSRAAVVTCSNALMPQRPNKRLARTWEGKHNLAFE